MAAQKKKKQKTTYYQVTPQATTEQQLRIQKMRDELNAPDPNDPHVFTRYKKITYPFVVLFPPYALYRIWCKKSEFSQREKYVQTAVCVLILFYFIAFRLENQWKLDDKNTMPNTFFPQVMMLIELIAYEYRRLCIGKDTK